MVIWLALLIPIFAIIILYIFFYKKIAWWESSSMFLVILILVLCIKSCTELSLTNDTEYIQDYVVRVEYTEAWDEWVTETCTRECCCVTDSKGNTTCGTETYDCSHREYYPEYYTIIMASGISYDIDKQTWFRLINQFKSKPIFEDMHRDFYTQDGDRYYILWNKDVNTIEYVVTSHTYENRIQASHSVLNFPEIDTSSIKYYDLKNYPKINNLIAPALLGDDNKKIDAYINRSNSLYASKKQAKVFYLIFKDKPLESALTQEQYWKGGNKNEVNICIGIDKNRKIKWVYVFSWTKKDIVGIKIKDYINKKDVLIDSTYKDIIDYSNNVIITDFERRHFKEFSYLTVEPSNVAIIWTFIISFIITCGLSYFVIINEFDSNI